MPIAGSIALLVVAVLLGVMYAIFSGLHRDLQEFAMLFGLGGWPGRLATVHALVWLIAVFVAGAPDGGWVLYSVIVAVAVGTVAVPFYANNREFLKTIEVHDEPRSCRTLSSTAEHELIPVSGTVIADGATASDIGHPIEPVTAPFTASPCAAHEWAVKRRQRFTRYTSYATVDSGEAAGEFAVDTGDGYVGVAPTDPTLLLVAGPGITGYETATSDPSSGADGTDGTDGPDRLSGMFTDDMRYCETTLANGDDVTVVGPLETGDGQDGTGLRLSDARGDRLFIVDDRFHRVKHIVDQYLRWTPHVAVVTLLTGWLYVLSLVYV